MMRLSCAFVPVYPPATVVELVRLAEELGFHGCYLGDDIELLDPWALVAAAAVQTDTIRLGFSSTHIYLREPTFVAQALATLDQFSNGRIESAVGIGGAAMLDAYGVEWRGQRPLDRLREALSVMRALLDHGTVTRDGGSFTYNDVSTMARPVQEHLPLLVAAMAGPRSLQLAGEVADGVHAAGCSKGYARYVVEQVAEGAGRAGRDWRELDLATWAITAVADDADVARTAARAMVAGWLPAFPKGLLQRHGVDREQANAVVDMLTAGETGAVSEQITDEIVDALCLAGTPEDIAGRIESDLVGSGINHVILGITDSMLVEGVSGHEVKMPDVATQLQLISERTFPALAGY